MAAAYQSDAFQQSAFEAESCGFQGSAFQQNAFQVVCGIQNTVTIDKWLQRLSEPIPIPRPAPVGGQPFIPPSEIAIPTNVVQCWPLVVGEIARPIAQVAPQGIYAYDYLRYNYHHEIEIGIEFAFSVDQHICGWGTASEGSDGFVPEPEEPDVWAEQGASPDVVAEQPEQTDAWSDQGERTDGYVDKDECGR